MFYCTRRSKRWTTSSSTTAGSESTSASPSPKNGERLYMAGAIIMLRHRYSTRFHLRNSCFGPDANTYKCRTRAYGLSITCETEFQLLHHTSNYIDKSWESARVQSPTKVLIGLIFGRFLEVPTIRLTYRVSIRVGRLVECGIHLFFLWHGPLDWEGWFGSLRTHDLSRQIGWPSAGFASRLADYVS